MIQFYIDLLFNRAFFSTMIYPRVLNTAPPPPMLHSRTPVFIHSLFNSLHPPARPPRLPPPPSQLSASLALFSCVDSSFVSQFRSVDSCCCVPPKWQIGSLFSKSALTFSHRSAHRYRWALPGVRPEVLGRRQWPGHTPAPTEHGAWS